LRRLSATLNERLPVTRFDCLNCLRIIGSFASRRRPSPRIEKSRAVRAAHRYGRAKAATLSNISLWAARETKRTKAGAASLCAVTIIRRKRSAGRINQNHQISLRAGGARFYSWIALAVLWRPPPPSPRHPGPIALMCSPAAFPLRCRACFERIKRDQKKMVAVLSDVMRFRL